MITVHHLNRSRSKRLLWILEELNLPYTVVNHQRDPQTNLAPASLKAIHPLGKAPVMVDKQITLCESAAIMEYLLDQASDTPLKPNKDSAEYYPYLQWLHFAEGSFAMPVITSMMLGLEDRDKTKPIDGYMSKELALDIGYIESTLTKQSYFAGEEFTACDIMMATTLEFAQPLGLLEGHSVIQNYLHRVQQRPAYLKACEYN